jgi:peptidyl-prolyl cis-trans isomerase D
MLDSLRKGASSWVAKILFGILVLSFAIWGIGDVFRGFGTNTLATIGGVSLSPQQYDQLFTRELRALSEKLDKQLTPQQGRALGLDQQVFSGLLIDAQVAALGLGLSDSALMERIQASPAFRGLGGKFDPERLRDIMRASGLSEQAFFAHERRQALREQTLSGIASELEVPSILLDAVNRYQNEKRVIDYFLIGLDTVFDQPAPDDAALKTFYERHKKDYAVPELRRLALLEADPEVLKAGFDVPESEQQAYYTAHEKSFDTPERRRVLQIVFPDKAAADKAHAELVAGKSFLDVARAAGRSDADVNRGVVTKDELVDPKVAEAAFSLAKDGFSAPIEGDLAVSIVRVSDIEPAVKKTFADVKDEIKDRLALDKATAQLQDLYDKVEDLRAEGAPLKDIAPQLGLKFTEVGGVSRAGMGADGKAVEAVTAATDLLRTAFEGDVGVETEPLERAKGGYVWLDVIEVIPEREKALDEVKPALREAYIKSEESKALSAKAEELTKRANTGEDLAKLAAESGGTVKTSEALTRSSSTADLPETAMPLAFSLATGAAAWTPSADDSQRLIFRLKSIEPAATLAEDTRKNIKARLAQLRAGDIASQYVSGLEKQYGLKVNQDLYNRLYQQSDQ